MKTLSSIIVKTQFLSIAILVASITLNGQSTNEFNNSIIHFEVNTPIHENNISSDFSKMDDSEQNTSCPIVIYYDDGTAEDYLAWVYPGGFVAVRFTPPGYPVKVTGGQLYVGDGTFPVGGYWLGSDFAICLFDDDGIDNMPGTLLDSVVVPINNYEWIVFDSIFDYDFYEGDFYIAMMQTHTPPNCAPIGVDMTSPTVYRSYARINDTTDWQVSPYQDFMIRAFIDNVTGEKEVLSNERINVYPNPATNVVTISSQKEISKIDVLNQIGQKVATFENVNSRSYKMDVSQLEKGIYFMRLNSEELMTTKKIIIGSK